MRKKILALYLRLSKEDGDLADESNSITNQRLILYKYIKQCRLFEGWQVKEYVDDGYSGRNFERPGMIRLMQDIRCGEVFGVIVKDFSRFGRNETEVGNYIEKIFPLLNIRFIAINNHYDSSNYIGTTPDMDISFINLMNDYFSYENSVKVKNDLLNRRMRGNYIATFPAYGYRKAENNHNQLVIDPDAAAIVRMIFERYAESRIKAKVAYDLNAWGVPTPQEYAQRKGIKYQWRYQDEKKLWSGTIVGKILRNPIYIGDTVFHKKEVAEAGSRREKGVSEEEWKICHNTHEAIVPKELFELVNQSGFGTYEKRKKSDPSEEPGNDRYCEGEKRRKGDCDSPIKGFVKCGGCKHNMQRRNRLKATYYCRHYYEVKDRECCSINVSETELMNVVLLSIRQYADMLSNIKELCTLQSQRAEVMRRQKESEKKEIAEKLKKNKTESFHLYEEYSKGELSRDTYLALKSKKSRLTEELQERLEQSSEEVAELGDIDREAFCIQEGEGQIVKLTRKLVEQLISAIYVYDNKRIEVVFRFQDEIDSYIRTVSKKD